MIFCYFYLVKSPTADVTWTKGAKRQMANLDRFIEELQTFDEHEMSESTLKTIQEHVVNRFGDPSTSVKINELRHQPYYDALTTLQEWVQNVIRYHILMNKHVKPLHAKCEEIEKEVKEADQKLIALNRKTEVLIYKN